MEAKKILFACIPADGHLNPMTGIAMELINRGHDVRWYTSKIFEEKLNKLGIPHYPFKKALEANQFNVDELFPERKKLKTGIPQLKFDLKNFFIYRAPEYFEDISEIKESFPFDIFVCDGAFTAGKLVKEKLKVPVAGIGIIPVMCTSKDLPPYGLGLTPDHSFTGSIKQKAMRFMAKNFIFKESSVEYNKILKSYDLPAENILIFDIPVLRSDVFLQSGTPGFEYERSDMPEKLKFVGPLHAYKKEKQKDFHYDWEDKLNKYKKNILISQGTFESDHSKLTIPALEGLKSEDYLLIVATGFHSTKELREKYSEQNIVIEDFIDFDFIMPRADVYITNGGYGGTLLAIDHALPMVAAGVNEGKNEICARIGFFKLGVNLRTEKPSPQKIKMAVNEILANPEYKKNVERLKNEFKQYDADKLSADYILSTLKK
ncbi:MAG TPA: nucleotide disphospho-sugar-binding domain-containing protein [Chitinophagaceae bacterium]|jgi:MGT family glycosyltransferase|nr:nucleotide disphospho-sugar-binding domain-containing protein [Chitinophagaceae bacterium]